MNIFCFKTINIFLKLMCVAFFSSILSLKAQTNIFPSNGNVGIGTAVPTDLLHLDNGGERKGIRITGKGDLGAYSDIIFETAGTIGVPNLAPTSWIVSYRKDGYFSGTPSGLSMEFYALKKGGGYFAPLCFKPNGDVVLASERNATAGNVGIGTVSPTEKLSVNGKIRAHEIKVETANWPDYVFQPDYELKPLSEVSKFIKENGHLPEVPKATEVESEGLSLGEMNKILLKKVEELTLHLIEMKGEINQQAKEIEELKANKGS